VRNQAGVACRADYLHVWIVILGSSGKLTPGDTAGRGKVSENHIYIDAFEKRDARLGGGRAYDAKASVL
jgi:hypothetical protein